MALKNITIHGVRSYGNKKTISFALPNKKDPGSGLNILLGPNNGGKSTIIECLYYLNNEIKHISENFYNKNCDGFIIRSQTDNNYTFELHSDKLGSAMCKNIIFDNHGKLVYNKQMNLFIISSKRNIDSNFGNSAVDRYSYTRNYNSNYRNNFQRSFGERLIKIVEKIEKNKFNCEMSKVICPAPEWDIKLSEMDNYYLEFKFGDITHKSVDSGDGYINLFNIIDALYDANPGDTIIIDEPEISLHPELQRNLLNLFMEHSKDKQIIIATHNIFMVNWNIFGVGGKIFRVVKENNNSNIYTLNSSTIENLKKLDDPEKIPILGLDTAEIFFLSDNIILTEGQEDVICYKKLFEKENYTPNASFFGWGVNGCNRMEYVLDFLYDLGYKKIFAIFDNDAKDEVEKLKRIPKYNNYKLYLISANDVRDKKDKEGNIIKKGIIKSMKNLEINDEYKDEIPNMILSMNDYFKDSIKNKSNSCKKVTIKSLDNNDYLQELVEEHLNLIGEKIYQIMEEVCFDFKFNLGEVIYTSIKNVNDKIICYCNCMQGTEFEKLNIIVKVIIFNSKIKTVKISKINNSLPYSNLEKIYRNLKIKKKLKKEVRLIKNNY